MLKKLLEKIDTGKDLSTEEASLAIEIMASGEALPSQIAAFLIALKMKGETVDEITGFALKMREMALKIDVDGLYPLVDSCGTGGDCTNTFNISTASAILASTAGLNVVKHSNSGFTSKCGSSNVLEALGISLVKTPKEVEGWIKRHNIAFIHAPYFHRSTQHVNPVRKELGVRTIFNFLGPLTNPAKPSGQVLGVSSPDMAVKIAEVLRNLGCEKALVVTGLNPVMDEISVCSETVINRLEEGYITKFTVTPEELGLDKASVTDLQGDTPEYNACIIEGIFKREITDSKLDAVLINTAAILWAGNMCEDLKSGINYAKKLILTDRAFQKLDELRKDNEQL